MLVSLNTGAATCMESGSRELPCGAPAAIDWTALRAPRVPRHLQMLGCFSNEALIRNDFAFIVAAVYTTKTPSCDPNVLMKTHRSRTPFPCCHSPAMIRAISLDRYRNKRNAKPKCHLHNLPESSSATDNTAHDSSVTLFSSLFLS